MTSGGGYSELARVLTERMKEAAKKDAVVDFGTIGKKGYLTTDALQITMNPDEYYVIEGVGELKDGDTVLVCWVYPDPVIIGKVQRGDKWLQ